MPSFTNSLRARLNWVYLSQRFLAAFQYVKLNLVELCERYQEAWSERLGDCIFAGIGALLCIANWIAYSLFVFPKDSSEIDWFAVMMLSITTVFTSGSVWFLQLAPMESNLTDIWETHTSIISAGLIVVSFFASAVTADKPEGNNEKLSAIVLFVIFLFDLVFCITVFFRSVNNR
jgi:hypothetical protein